MKYPKPGKKVKHGKTAEEKAHLDWVASLGCVICGKPANIHHVRSVASKRDHTKVIPLCYYHHQGKMGIHTIGKKIWWEQFGHELDYLKQIQERLWKMK
jgi:hypothetical protein